MAKRIGDVASLLAGAMNRGDEAPNIELAERLAAEGSAADIEQLVELIGTGPKAQRHDAIKAFYEFAERQPPRALPHLDAMIALLGTKDNRMLWGALSALAAMAPAAPENLMPHLDDILAAADRGSVIAKDATMKMLATLNSDSRFAAIVTPIILQRLRYAAVNQTPMYAELAAPTIRTVDWPEFEDVVAARLSQISQPAKTKRLHKVLARGPQ